MYMNSLYNNNLYIYQYYVYDQYMVLHINHIVRSLLIWVPKIFLANMRFFNIFASQMSSKYQ